MLYIKNSMFMFAVTIISLWPSLTYAESEQLLIPWKTWKQDENAKVSYRQNKNEKLYQIKANVNVKSTLSGFLLFLQDTDNIPLWLASAQQSSIIKKFSEEHLVFITYFKAFWPVKTRAMLIESRHWQNKDLSLEIKVKNASQVFLKNEKRFKAEKTILIKIHYAHWKITPLYDDTINIEYIVSADPQGRLPSWLVNKITLKSMWSTLKNIQQYLPISVWQKHTLDNIVEIKNTV